MSVCGEPITKCPVCRYDLTGLPKNHTCPECGFEYDDSMRIWYAARLSINSLMFAFLFFILYAFTIASISRFTRTGSPFFPLQFWLVIWFPLTVVLSLLLLLIGLIWYFSKRSPRAFVIVARDALYINSLLLGGLAKLHWTEIELQGRAVQQFMDPDAPSRKWPMFHEEMHFRIIPKGQNVPPKCYILPTVARSRKDKCELFRAIYQRWTEADMLSSASSASLR